ncbi:MAG: transposase [Candidatus Nitrosotenuis sp.]
MGETVKKVRRGSIVYTDKWRGYDSLFFGYKHLSVDHKYKFKSGKAYINGIEGSGVLQKKGSSNIMASAPTSSCCTSRRWNGGITTAV